MMLFLGKLLKCALKIPVLFAHFPCPTIMLVGITFVVSSVGASYLTHKLEASARAELKADVAEVKAEHSGAVTTAALARVDAIAEATAVQNAINNENQKAWLAAVMALAPSAKDKQAIDRLTRAVEELHNDATYDCRRKPLPVPYLDSLQVDGEPAPVAQ